MSHRQVTGLEVPDLLGKAEQLLYTEADLLDEHRFREWLDLFTDDVRYRMPLVRNLRFDQISQEYLEGPLDVAWLDEGKETLLQRVEQILTGVHWAEEPLSRTTHIVTNVRVVDAVPPGNDAELLTVTCRFLAYRHRLQDQEDVLIGRRRDRLSRAEGPWKIAQRDIYINQSVLLSRSLSFII